VHDIVLVAMENNWAAIEAHTEMIRKVLEVILRDGIANGEFEAADAHETSVVIKRSMGKGYAGIDNELYVNPKTGMLFADAKAGLEALTQAVKAL